MGEIIIKVPEDVHEVIDLTEKGMEDLESIVKRIKSKLYLKKNVEKYIGKFDLEDTNEEELHLQGD